MFAGDVEISRLMTSLIGAPMGRIVIRTSKRDPLLHYSSRATQGMSGIPNNNVKIEDSDLSQFKLHLSIAFPGSPTCLSTLHHLNSALQT